MHTPIKSESFLSFKRMLPPMWPERSKVKSENLKQRLCVCVCVREREREYQLREGTGLWRFQFRFAQPWPWRENGREIERQRKSVEKLQ